MGQFLREAADSGPVLVVLDDLHAADAPSLLLLRFLAQTATDERLVIVGAYRDAEPRVHELADLFGDLARVGRRLPLHGLSRPEVAAYMGRLAGRSLPPAVVARVHEVTGGNPAPRRRAGPGPGGRWPAGRVRGPGDRPAAADPRGAPRPAPSPAGRPVHRGRREPQGGVGDRPRLRAARPAPHRPRRGPLHGHVRRRRALCGTGRFKKARGQLHQTFLPPDRFRFAFTLYL